MKRLTPIIVILLLSINYTSQVHFTVEGADSQVDTLFNNTTVSYTFTHKHVVETVLNNNTKEVYKHKILDDANQESYRRVVVRNHNDGLVIVLKFYHNTNKVEIINGPKVTTLSGLSLIY